MGRPAARITDMHTCPMITVLVPHVGGPILPTCCPTVLIGGLPAARVTDFCTCVGPPDVIVQGSATVFIGGLPAARIGDMTVHGGVIVTGMPTVLIGDDGSADMGVGPAFGKPGEQARTLVEAAKQGTPFLRALPMNSLYGIVDCARDARLYSWVKSCTQHVCCSPVGSTCG